MRIGLAQLNMGFEEKETAKTTCRRIIADAKNRNVDFLIFPETTLTGFTLQPKIYGEKRSDSSSITFFCDEAKTHNMNICFGLPLVLEHTCENHCIIIDRQGTILADYAKIHPFSYGEEAKHYTGGNALSFCKVDGVCVSPLICYDLRFPEIFQIASLQSKIITVIANWPIARREHWISLLKARALETQCFFIGVNRIGDGGGLHYGGDSMVISPTGEILLHATNADELAIIDINPEEANIYQEKFPLKRDRRPELYHSLWEQHK